MSPARTLVADLAKAGKPFQEIRKTVEAVYGEKVLKKTAIYAILNKVKTGQETVDQRHSNAKKC
jgi:hypothetical protein